MRVWDIAPCFLNRQSLLGEHREIHAIHTILSQGKSGYFRHPETRRWSGQLAALRFRHDLVTVEMLLRGFKHHSPLFPAFLSRPENRWPKLYPSRQLISLETQVALLNEKYRGKEQGRIPLPTENSMATVPFVAISACLAGLPTRYDGESRQAVNLLTSLSMYRISLLPICPETESGLGLPREPMRLEGASPRLVTCESRRDLTASVVAWGRKRLPDLIGMGVRGFILKARSPSCGKRVPIYASENTASHSPGLFNRQVMADCSLPVADEEELSDPKLLQAFCDRLIIRKINSLMAPP